MPKKTLRTPKLSKREVSRLVMSELQKCGMEVFYLNRLEDVHSVSGTGVVAVGVQLPSKKCVMEWLTEFQTETIFESLDHVEKIHGHEGKTLVVKGLPPKK